MTERFSREEFERCLPTAKAQPHVEAPLWKPLGLVGGEYCYVVRVTSEVEIYIRSSIKSDGLAANTGKDSIRCTLVDAVDRKPLAAKNTKSQRWIARTSGWRENLLSLLREMYKLGLQLGTCKKCGKGQLVLRKSTTAQNPNRLFISCKYGDRQDGCGYFHWVQEKKEVASS